MTQEAVLKSLGYSVSTVSVFCLGAVAWDGAKDKPPLLLLLLLGMATSIVGMLLRWIALIVKERETRQRETAIARQEVQRSLNVEGTSATTARRP